MHNKVKCNKTKYTCIGKAALFICKETWAFVLFREKNSDKLINYKESYVPIKVHP